MSARREPSVPPEIPGYEPRRLLGMGGFADVFLYEQQMPRRSVAVKVLLPSALSEELRERFRAEAGVMARLSQHPSIVTIHDADVASDGRPYLVMEYCSRPGLGARYRTERMAVAEVLRIGVRLAAAVETAHRAGILHRDIKPANVLVTDFGWPALSDFGIAAATGSGAAVGMSIPWAPPELLAEVAHGDVRSDVYSLAATVYSLLARRSPFEVPDGPNTAADVISRIERAPLPPTGRDDVPDSLQDVLARAMDKDPVRRHPSALALARSLQHVEAELHLPRTSVDVVDDVAQARARGAAWPALGTENEQDLPTRIRPVVSVSPDAAVPGTAGPAGPAEPPPSPKARAPGARALLGALAGVAVVAAAATGVALAFRGGGIPAPTPQPTVSPSVPAVRAVPAPTDLAGTVAGDGSVVFTWTNPDPQDGDRYLWGPAVPGGPSELEVVPEPTVTVERPGGGQVCVEVSIVRADGRYSTTPAVGCAP